ncbi:hypothetical protein [Nocardia asiatica]|uniref:hypothetical protein n=1 Tax=Nocardia asiatica TaxID=209252 RepID=UPI000306BA76|nr:hypothetical protein [Nocardia asiatica]
MGYYIQYDGVVTIHPPLNLDEIAYLGEFSYIEHGSDKPDVYCMFRPNEDGDGIAWSGDENFYNGEQWLRYLIDHFLKPGAQAAGTPGFERFTFDHILNGILKVTLPEDDAHTKLIIVRDNLVTEHDPIQDFINSLSSPGHSAAVSGHLPHEHSIEPTHQPDITAEPYDSAGRDTQSADPTQGPF